MVVSVLWPAPAARGACQSEASYVTISRNWASHRRAGRSDRSWRSPPTPGQTIGGDSQNSPPRLIRRRRDGDPWEYGAAQGVVRDGGCTVISLRVAWRECVFASRPLLWPFPASQQLGKRQPKTRNPLEQIGVTGSGPRIAVLPQIDKGPERTDSARR
jgi:hypothetical protein